MGYTMSKKLEENLTNVYSLFQGRVDLWSKLEKTGYSLLKRKLGCPNGVWSGGTLVKEISANETVVLFYLLGEHGSLFSSILQCVVKVRRVGGCSEPELYKIHGNDEVVITRDWLDYLKIACVRLVVEIWAAFDADTASVLPDVSEVELGHLGIGSPPECVNESGRWKIRLSGNLDG